MKKSNIYSKLEKKIEKCEKDINDGVNVGLRTEQKKHYLNRLRTLKHIRRTVTSWERSNHLWFDGSESDVCSFDDLVDYCNENSFSNDKPLDVICEGVFVAIGGSAIVPYDLREYIYLPSSLIEEDVDVRTIREAFDGFGEEVVQF